MSKKVLIIPLAGAGSRFQNKGWKIPKPFIPINGDSMLLKTLRSFSLAVRREMIYKILLIARVDHRAYLDCFLSNLSKKEKENIEVCYLPQMTQGAACTVLAARKYYTDNSIIVADCDTSYDENDILEFCEILEKEKPSLALTCFFSKDNKFSYIDDSKIPPLLAEKKVISYKALSGIYFFDDSSLFNDAVMDLMIYGEKEMGEYYISRIVKECAERYKLKVYTYMLSKERIYFYGTPEQLSEYVNSIGE